MGSKKNKSSISACQSFIGNTEEALDGRSFAVGIFFDLTKMYDFIYHDIPLEKLDHYRIRRKINFWIKSYLTLKSVCRNNLK